MTRIAPGVAALVAELRGHEQQAAAELEQWKTHHEERWLIDASPAAITLALLLTDEELDSLERRAGDGEIAMGGRPGGSDQMSQALSVEARRVRRTYVVRSSSTVHTRPPESVANVRHLPDPERRHRVSKRRARPRHRPHDRRAKLLWRVRPPDGLAPIQHIHSRQAKRRSRTEQHHRHAMAHQVQNHEPTASTPNVPDHLDKILIAQVVHQAHAYGHVGSRQNLPHGVQLENRELPHATLRRMQIHAQYLRPNLPPHFFQQRAVPTPDIQNAPRRLPITPQRPQDRRMVTQQAVR